MVKPLDIPLLEDEKECAQLYVAHVRQHLYAIEMATGKREAMDEMIALVGDTNAVGIILSERERIARQEIAETN